MKDVIRRLIQRYWVLRLVAFLLLKPGRFLTEFWYPVKDFKIFKASVEGYQNFLDKNKDTAEKDTSLLIVAGVMSGQWCQLWMVIAAVYKAKGAKITVLSSRGQPVQNLYFKLFNIDIIYLEDLNINDFKLPRELITEIATKKQFEEIKFYEYKGSPIGKMALSTYSRMATTGIMDVSNDAAIKEVHNWMEYLCKTMLCAEKLYKELDVNTLFFTELFMDYYGGLYYQALNQELNISRFAGTVRDNAVVITHQTHEHDRKHFSSISDEVWSEITEYDWNATVDAQLAQNFSDRYGDKWQLSSRNQRGARIVDADAVRQDLELKKDDKVAIIYSHILYDTLFFNGEYLFANYAEWLVESIKAACENDQLIWYVKIHPSNLWRGELEHSLGGVYEEERLIKEYIGDLPPHVRLIYPTTPYSPYTWLHVADYGITVTGTSGIELGALGKTVVTAGTGRYEKVGFTINSDTKSQYLDLLRSLHKVEEPSSEQKMLGKKFAYSTFCLKPFTLDFFSTKPKCGKEMIKASEDLVYVGNFDENMTDIPNSLKRFMEWNKKPKRYDLLNEWGSEKAS